MAILVLFAAIYSVHLIAIRPIFHGLYSVYSGHSSLQSSLIHKQSQMKAIPALKSEIIHIENSRLWRGLLPLTSTSVTIQQQFRDLIEQHGIYLDSIQPAEAEEFDKIRRLRLKVRFTASFEQLNNLLRTMDQQSFLIRFEDLLVNAPSTQMENANPTLNIQGDVVAFQIKEEVR